MAHAILSASGSSRWLACPPSARLEAVEPDSTSVYAEEGTLAHEICELIVRYNNKEFSKQTFNRRLNKLKKHELYCPEMMEYCEQYQHIVWEKLQCARKKTIDAHCIVEQRLDFSNYVPDGFGTGDALIIADDAIEVIDFKYGKGVEVSADNNTQMKLYGLGALNEYEMLFDIKEIHLTIVQPRINNISESTLSVDDLYNWGNEIRPIAETAYKGKGDFKAGEHCKFCKIKAKCKTYADEQLKLAEYDFKTGPYLNNIAIVDILKRATEFKKWISSVEEYALDQAVNYGRVFPDMKVVEGKSRRVYANKDEVLKTLISNGYEEVLLYKPKELLGITAMEKAIGKKEFNELLSDLVIKPQGKPTLVPLSDKRPPIHSELDAKNDFKGDM